MAIEKKKKVVVGGTFDIFHEGHKAFLRKAFALVEEDKSSSLPFAVARVGEVTIGLTSNILAKNTKKRRVKDFKYRKKELEDFIKKEFKVKPKIVKIEDKFGPTLKEDFDYIVVSPITYPTAALINRKRQKRNKKPIKIVKIEFVLAEDGKPISTTKILKREIDRQGKLLKQANF